MSDLYEKTNTPGVYKDVVTKKYWIKFDYQDFTGEKRTVKKRGFKKIKDAIDFKIDFLQNQASSSSIRFSAFYESYINDMSKRLRKNTVENKRYIIELKILPYFGKKKINEITKADREKIVGGLKNFKLHYAGLYDIETAIVTSGGVSLKEINPKTFESKLQSGLYFVGEVLDVDALTGGYNLQIAWATAYAMANNLKKSFVVAED